MPDRLSWEWRADPVRRPQRGAEDGERPFGENLWGGLRGAAGAGAVRDPCGRDLPNQGSRQYRGRAAEPADRLWPRRRPHGHRRHPQQHPLHQAIAAGDARADGRQHPRRHHPHRQRRRRHGHRQSARVRHPGHADGRHGIRARRRQGPAGRHPARHPPARRRRQRLRGGAGLGRDLGFPGRGRGRQDRPRRADRRPHRQRRHHRARDRVRAEPLAQCAAGAAQCRFHHRQAHRRRGQRLSRRQDAPSRSIPPPCSSRFQRNSRATSSPS